MDQPKANLTEKENTAMQIDLSINVIKWLKVILSVIVLIGSVISAILGLIFNQVYSVNLNQGIFQANFINHEEKDASQAVVVNGKFEKIDVRFKEIEDDVEYLQGKGQFNVSEN